MVMLRPLKKLDVRTEAILVNAPKIALGASVESLSAGRMIRDANKNEMSIFLASDDNKDFFANNASNSVPFTGQTKNNIVAKGALRI